mgnify:CR=1 FL=1
MGKLAADAVCQLSSVTELPCISTSMDMSLLTQQSVLFMFVTKSSQDLRVPQINQMYTYRQPKKIKLCDPKNLIENFF